MKRLAILGMFVTVAGVSAGCAMRDDGLVRAGDSSLAAGTATADARTAAGMTWARAMATQVGDSIRVRVEAMGMPRGTYAAHIHTTGSCVPPDFTSAGGHWNPTNQQHGRLNPAGQHKGDLPNLTVGTDGRGSFEYTIPSAWIRGGAMPMLDADGAAIVIHAQADDYRTDPSGSAGARVACGVFG